MVGPQRLLADRQDALGERLGLGVLAFTIELDDLGVERVGVVALLCGGRRRKHEPPRHHYPRHKPRETRHDPPLPQSDDQMTPIMTRCHDGGKARQFRCRWKLPNYLTSSEGRLWPGADDHRPSFKVRSRMMT